MLYEEINLTKEEKHSLRSFWFHKKQKEEDIKCWYSLWHTYHLISQNYTGEVTEFGEDVFDGTYSTSDTFKRYMASRRKWMFAHLPSWIALITSFVSLTMSIYNFLIATGMIELTK